MTEFLEIKDIKVGEKYDIFTPDCDGIPQESQFIWEVVMIEKNSAVLRSLNIDYEPVGLEVFKACECFLYKQHREPMLTDESIGKFYTDGTSKEKVVGKFTTESGLELFITQVENGTNYFYDKYGDLYYSSNDFEEFEKPGYGNLKKEVE